MIGSRVMVLASTGLALNGPVAARGLAQASDLEGLWKTHEAEGGETVFAGF